MAVKKKLFSVLTATALTLGINTAFSKTVFGSITDITASAAVSEDEEISRELDASTPAFVGKLSASTCKAGDTVYLTVSTANNPGVNGWLVSVKYDTNTFERVIQNSYETAFGGNVIGSPSGVNPARYLWSNYIAGYQYTTNGLMFKVPFKVKSTAQAGNYTFTIKSEGANAVYGDRNNPVNKTVSFTTVSPTVSVQAGTSQIPTVKGTPGDGSVTLKWSAVSGAEKYGIVGYMNGSWQLLDQCTATSYVLKNLKSGTDYKVAVIVMKNGKWNQDFSNVIVVTPNVSKVPTLAYEKGDGCVKLNWTAVPGAEKYGIAAFISGKWNLLDQGTGTSYVLKNLKAGTMYKVAVVGMFSGKWNLDYSNALSVTPKEVQTTAYPIVKTIDYNEEFHQFKVTWSPVTGAEQYGVAVKLMNKWKVMAYTAAKTTSFISPKLTPGSRYELVVCAKVNGKYDLNKLANRVVTVTVK